MSEVKQIFTSGKMNKDLDERIIPNGEYRDALNLNSTTSEGENVGSLQNLLGNEMVHQVNNSLIGAKTIGSVRYEKEKKLYWFLASNNLDGIYEYNQEQNKVNPVIVETKDEGYKNLNDINISSDENSNLIFTKFVKKEIEEIIDNVLDVSVTGAQTIVKTNVSLNNNRHNLNIDIPKGTVIEYTKDEGLLFYDTEYSGIDIIGITVISTYVYGNILNFNKDKLITGVNIIDGMLFWTDNFNQPRKINIKKFLKHTDGNFDKTTKINNQNFLERHISVAKLAPMSAPSLSLKEALVDGTDNVSNIAYNFKNPEKFASGSSQETDIELTDLPLDLTWQINESIKAVAIDDSSTNNVNEAPEVNLKVKSISTTSVGKNITLTITSIEGNDFDATYTFLFDSQKGKALYELKFPMFSYRWKYKDNEYSVFSPFSETAFLPGEFFYNTETGYNMSMENNVKRIVLNEIEIGNEDVEEIDILYKDSRNSNIYTVDTVKRINELGTTFPGSYTITKEKIDAVVESNQILRQWDNVPRKALAQEITGNRVVYGNYLQNFNIPISTKLDLTVEKSGNPIPNTSIKSNRNYQVGVVYIDEFNRQSPVQTGTADLDGGTILSISGEDPWTNKAIGAKVTSPPPAWATHFKYFIKESSMEYYNLALDNIYQEKNDTGFVWLSFSSNDINKIRPDKLVEDFIVLKKAHSSDTPVPFSQDSRFKVLDIQRDPPGFLSENYNLKTQLDNIVFAKGAPPPMGSNTNRAYTDIISTALINATPVPGGTQIAIRSASQASISDVGVKEDAWKNDKTGEILIKSGMYVEFTRFTKTRTSNKYRIKRVIIEKKGDVELGIEIEGGFQEDVNFLYENNNKDGGNYLRNGSSNATNGYTDVTMSVYEKDIEPNRDAKFAGRFFVKVENKNSVEKHLIEAGILGSKSAGYLTYKNIELHSKDQSDSDKNCKRSKKQTGDERRKRASWFLKQGGGIGQPTINYNNRNFHFHVVGSTCIADTSGFLTLKTGQKIKFDNHDSIYEITDLVAGNIEYNYTKGGILSSNKPVTLPQVYFKVKDIETEKEILKETVLQINQQGKRCFIQVVKLDATEFDFKSPNPAIFETEPRESPSELDIYYETQDAYSISEIGKKQILRWYNCFNFNGVETNRIRDDYNAPTISKGVRVSATLAEKYKEERVFNGLIHSGIINSKNSINRSNEFIQAEAITKNLLPSYGGIQKLHSRDNDIVVFCENKVVKVLSDKDILYNADGSGNVRAARTPLGTTVAYKGEFGIGENPESFASFGYRAYFIDRPRGNVLRLSGDGIERISRYGMTNFWQNNLSKHSRFIGSYDEANNLYNITIPCLYTTCFDDAVNGWTSRKSWVSDFGVSLNNNFYTYKDGNLWLHESSSVPRNNFYGEQYVSSLQCTMNESPSIIKRFKTIAYEGTNDWKARLTTDQNKSSTMSFIDKENKYFSYIKGEAKNTITLNTKNFSVQGLGRSVSVDLNSSTSTTPTLLSVPVSIQPKKVPGINCDNTLITSDGVAISTSTVKVDKTDPDKTYCVELFAKQGYDFTTGSFSSSLGSVSPKGNNKQICFTGKELLEQQENNKNLESAFKDSNSIIIDDVEDLEGKGTPITTTASSDVTIYWDGNVNETVFTVNGDYAFSGTNATIDSSSGTYSVVSKANTKAYIQERIITPSSGYELDINNVTVNNNRITLEKKLNSDGTITIKEHVSVQGFDENDVDYTVSATATTIAVSKKSINSFYANPTKISGDGGDVFITIGGTSGASGKLIITDSSGNQVTGGSIDFKIN